MCTPAFLMIGWGKGKEEEGTRSGGKKKREKKMKGNRGSRIERKR